MQTRKYNRVRRRRYMDLPLPITEFYLVVAATNNLGQYVDY